MSECHFARTRTIFYTWLDIGAVKFIYYFPKSVRYNILVTTINMPSMPGSSLCPPTIHRGDTLGVGNNETFVEKLCFIERKLPVITHLQLPTTHRAFASLARQEHNPWNKMFTSRSLSVVTIHRAAVRFDSDVSSPLGYNIAYCLHTDWWSWWVVVPNKIYWKLNFRSEYYHSSSINSLRYFDSFYSQSLWVHPFVVVICTTHSQWIKR